MKKRTKPQPMNYGPYVIEPPSGTGPFLLWHARGPSLDVGGTCEQSIRMHAMQANACYQQGVKAGGRDDLLAACEACAAWHWAEREVPKRLTTFDERMALCRYSEWMTLRALTVASGKSPDSEPYAGLLCVWTGRRPTSEQERVVVDRILCEYRASIAKAEGGAA